MFIQLLKADSSLVKNVPSSLGSKISGKLCEKLVETMEFTMLCTMAFPGICGPWGSVASAPRSTSPEPEKVEAVGLPRKIPVEPGTSPI